MTPLIRIKEQLNLIKTENYKCAKFSFENFNPVQSGLFEIYDKDANCIVATSTSSGKTICFEMFAAYEVRVRKNKVIYLSPLKALSQEKYEDWTNNHHFSDLKISICTGDYRLTPARIKELNEADIIIMTSEMLNSYPYKTEVWCHNNGKFWLDEIGRLVEENVVCDVMSYHKGIGVIPTQITGRICVGEKMIYEIRLAGGRSVRMTESHNLFIKGTNGNLKEVKLKDIKKKNKVALSKGFITPSKESKINFLDILKQINYKNQKTIYLYGEGINKLLEMPSKELSEICPLGCVGENEPIGTQRRISAWKKRQCLPLSKLLNHLKKNDVEISEIGIYHSSKKLPKIISVDKELAWVLGFYLAEGCVSENNIMLGQKTIKSLERCQKIIGGKIKSAINNFGRSYYYLYVSNVLLSYLFKTFGPTANKKIIPSFVFSWKKEEIESFLDGYWEGDGTINNDKSKSYYTSSKQLSKDIQNILLIVGKQSYRTMSHGTKIFYDSANNNKMWKISEQKNKHPWLRGRKNQYPDLAFRSVKSIIPIGIEKVYDLEIAPKNIPYKIENWIGGQGGIMLHNSTARNYKADKNQFLQSVGMLGIDESHLLGVSGRGDHLESGIMKFTEVNNKARIMMLSATMPNVDEVGKWLHSLNGKSTYLLESKYRPCKLNIHYEQYADEFNYEENEKKKIWLTCQLVKKYSNDKFICFVHTKRTGEMLLDHLGNIGIRCDYHNANLDKDKRVRIENQFREDPNLRVIVATSGLAQGLNLPARRVIIVGVHRGLTEVESHDIIQMAGRAGRPQYDPEGDAYILLPKKKFDYHKERLEAPVYIQSQMKDPKVLAFHLVSEIHHGTIKNLDDVDNWYSRTLAHFQKNNLDSEVVDKVIQHLVFSGCIKNEDGKFSTTTTGTVASMFYYSPFDVADLSKNFSALFKSENADNDIWLAMTLGNTDSHRMNIVNTAEREEMKEFFDEVSNSKIEKILSPKAPFTPGAMKAGYCFLQLLQGNSSRSLNNIMRLLQMDFGRTSEVLTALDTMSSKWEQGSFFKELGLRMAYGVPIELVNLCSIKNIGKVKAKKLYEAGIKDITDIKDVVKIINTLKCSKKVAEDLIAEAKRTHLKNQLG